MVHVRSKNKAWRGGSGTGLAREVAEWCTHVCMPVHGSCNMTHVARRQTCVHQCGHFKVASNTQNPVDYLPLIFPRLPILTVSLSPEAWPGPPVHVHTRTSRPGVFREPHRADHPCLCCAQSCAMCLQHCRNTRYRARQTVTACPSTKCALDLLQLW